MDDGLEEFTLSKEAKAFLRDKERLKEALESGKTGQDILGFSNKTMAKFYDAAYRLFQHKRYEDSAKAFLFLVTLNAYNEDYWLGLGMSAQMSGDFQSAIDAYELAAVCNIDNPVPYFYLSKCLFAIHDRKSSLEALDIAIEYAGDKEEYAELKQQALAAKALLLNEQD